MTKISSTLTLRNLLKDQDMATAIADIEAEIRQKPTNAPLRWQLFQLLCLTGNWNRAEKQLARAIQGMTGSEVTSSMDPQTNLAATLYRHLIEAEITREQVFSGIHQPEFIASPPQWITRLTEALALEQAGEQDKADIKREEGLGNAPSVPGKSTVGQFSWIADADSRLGPICEAIIGGRYYWLPLDQINQISLPAPVKTLDIIWAPASLTLHDGRSIEGHIPARYPYASQHDLALQLGKKTEWHEQGESGIFGAGQKMWMHDAGEWALLEIHQIEFGTLTP